MTATGFAAGAISDRSLAEHRLRSHTAVLRWALGIFLLGMCIYLPGLGSGPLAGTEGHRSLTAHQMVQSGEWLVPKLDGRLYLRKPPLHYWLVAIAECVGGAHELVWRLPSAISSALTAAVAAFFAGRWFGARACFPAGLACLLCVAIWPQSRTAEIDADNTFAAIFTTLCLIDLFAGAPQRLLLLTLSGIGCGATLLMKGPGGLMPIGGAMLAASFCAWRGEILLRPWWPRFWLPLMIGFGVFGIWVAAAWHWVVAHGLAGDLSGLREASHNLAPASLARFGQALILPPTMLAYTLPVSACVPMAIAMLKRRAFDHSQRPYAILLLLTLAAASGIGLASGLVNPRYAYVYMPLLGPLAGGVVAIAVNSGEQSLTGLRRIMAFVMILSMSAPIISLAAFRVWEVGLWLVVASSIAVGLFGLFAINRPSLNQQLAIIAALTVLFAIIYGDLFGRSRVSRSGFTAAPIIRREMGNGRRVLVGGVLRLQPELMYYAGVDAIALGEDLPPPSDVAEPQWVLLNANEYHSWTQAAPQRLSRVTPFETNHSKVYLLYLLAR